MRYRVLMGRPVGKRPLQRPRRRWENNKKMDFQKCGRDSMDYIHLAQDRDRWRAPVNVVLNFRVPHSAGNFLQVGGLLAPQGGLFHN